jgi:glucosamine-6-phosphate deaminase
MESVSKDGARDEGLFKRFRAGQLNVHVYESRAAMGAAAAAAVAAELRRLLGARGRAVAVFASAPSQNEFLASLTREPGVEWPRVKGFHLDEWAGMVDAAPQSFRKFLLDRLVHKVEFGEFDGLRGEAPDLGAEAERYAARLAEDPPDFAVLGIGENGHLAFIDPPFCDFEDPLAVKVVELDEVCRRQQVNDGLFAGLEEVPRNALSLTIPTIMARPKLFAIVPGPAKRDAIKAAVEGPIATSCPASILRNHPDAHLFIDRDSASLLSL